MLMLLCLIVTKSQKWTKGVVIVDKDCGVVMDEESDSLGNLWSNENEKVGVVQVNAKSIPPINSNLALNLKTPHFNINPPFPQRKFLKFLYMLDSLSINIPS